MKIRLNWLNRQKLKIMRTKNFEQVIRKLTEEFKEYCDGKDIQESATEKAHGIAILL